MESHLKLTNRVPPSIPPSLMMIGGELATRARGHNFVVLGKKFKKMGHVYFTAAPETLIFQGGVISKIDIYYPNVNLIESHDDWQ